MKGKKEAGMDRREHASPRANQIIEPNHGKRFDASPRSRQKTQGTTLA
jgi:hypothetical protein